MTFIKLDLKRLGIEDQYFFINPEDQGLSRQLIRNKLREPINCFYLVKLLKNFNGAVLDIGGNIGYFPLIEAQAFKGPIRVYEPVQENFNLLLKNVGDRRNVQAIKAAVGDHDGTALMHITDRLNNCSLTDNAAYNARCNIKQVKASLVPVVSLDHAAQDLKKVLVRCDIEGYETTVFNQVPEQIKVISLEFHAEIIGVKRSLEFLDHLENQGFSVGLMTRELDGFIWAFRRLGYLSVKIYERMKEKRVYREPTKKQVRAIIEKLKENPHLTLFRDRPPPNL